MYKTLAAGQYHNQPTTIDFFTGLRVVFDGAQPVGHRVINVTIRCIECEVPKYETLVLDKYYRVVTTDFIGNGGGEFTVS